MGAGQQQGGGRFLPPRDDLPFSIHHTLLPTPPASFQMAEHSLALLPRMAHCFKNLRQKEMEVLEAS